MNKNVSWLVLHLSCAAFLGGCGFHQSRSFVEGSANSQKIDAKGEVELITAIAADDPEGLAQALVGGFGLDHRFSDGQTLLIRALSLGKIRCARWLIERGASATAGDAEGKTPCDHAGSVAELRQLLQCPLDPLLVRDAFEAVRSGNIRKTQSLLREGLDPNLRDESGETLLIAAVKAAQPRMIEMLVRGFLSKGLDLNLRDHEGRTALGWARETNQIRIVSLLESNDAKE